MSTVISKENIFDVVVQHTRAVIPDLQSHTFVSGDSLRDLGANSIDRADIVMEVMDTFGLKIPRIELLGPRSIGELVDLLHGKLSAA